MGGGATVVVIIPVLNRPANVAPLLASLGTDERIRPLFVVTEGDREEISAIRSAGAELLPVPRYTRGDYAKKINAGYRHSTEPFLFLAADDLRFHDGWLDAALPAFENPLIGVVGTQDLGNERVLAGEHATHSLVRRRYVDVLGVIDRPGVLCEMYPHEFVDDEFVETAKSRNAWAFAHGSIVEHLHPNWGKADTDPLYDASPRRMMIGRSIYRRRRHLWTSQSSSPHTANRAGSSGRSAPNVRPRPNRRRT